MKYIAAYALLALNKEKVTRDDLTSLLSNMGVEVEPEPVDQLINSLSGMPISEAISLGFAKMNAHSAESGDVD
jgi:ribosomal protein L12E/L44/L45/RPP1/RPP2